jgi:hypothetical protein
MLSSELPLLYPITPKILMIGKFKEAIASTVYEFNLNSALWFEPLNELSF